MINHAELDSVFQKFNFNDYKWIAADSIVVAQWVRMKCTFGCTGYGKTAMCPPNMPAVADCERFVREYTDAVLLRFSHQADNPADRHPWSAPINMDLLKLEREIFLRGYQKAFILLMSQCPICAECVASKDDCRNPKLARPAAEAFAIDLFSTVRASDYPITVLSDYSDVMNRYAILLVQ